MEPVGLMARTNQRDRSPTTARPYAAVPLVVLLERIVERADREALAEFHNRRACFRLFGGAPLRFGPFLNAVRETQWARSLVSGDTVLLDDACDAVTDKFSNLPTGVSETGSHARPGPDCRLYFGAVLRTFRKWRNSLERLHPLEGEAHVARLLQRFVLKHLRLSCLEAKRRARPGRSRYAWHTDSRVIYLWMPTSLTGHQRRNWLQEHIHDFNLSRPRERERIQTLIDAYFGIPRRLALNSGEVEDELDHRAGAEQSLNEEGDHASRVLARAVADEKAGNLSPLRPAIRSLGADRLRELIGEIFTAIDEEDYRPHVVARRFGLSQATMSRFAGRRWKAGAIPDLWANTAQLLGRYTSLLDSVRASRAVRTALDALSGERPSTKEGRHG